ncbi:MBL fold metallo-hydrolase [Metasolibacillus fluoroglycofenilyticus]|uniref:MBL fold metallo-hydrolase n=1 Tax=Metasolibacillus fluoroglycofenilyticus TaxID=1239396 RepID=UPI000D357B64|nr:MBL fold metallo-hydrolase [Metasolibacillus fluoroglycofenilyticus]
MIHFQNEQLTIYMSQLFKTTSTVIETEDCIVLVDPNWLPQEIETIQAHIAKIQGDRPLYILFTHSDWDHIIGYGAFPEAIVIASETFQKRSDKEQIIEQIRTFDDGYYIDRAYSVSYPKVDIVIRHDAQTLIIGKTKLTFYLANGHTNDGLFIVVEPQGIWIAGDYLSDVEFPYIYDNSYAYEETLKKVDVILQQHEIRFLIPGHGNMTTEMEEIKKRQRDATTYIKELRRCIAQGEDSAHLIANYAYPRNMREFHKGNIRLMEEEK